MTPEVLRLPYGRAGQVPVLFRRIKNPLGMPQAWLKSFGGPLKKSGGNYHHGLACV